MSEVVHMAHESASSFFQLTAAIYARSGENGYFEGANGLEYSIIDRQEEITDMLGVAAAQFEAGGDREDLTGVREAQQLFRRVPSWKQNDPVSMPVARVDSALAPSQRLEESRQFGLVVVRRAQWLGLLTGPALVGISQADDGYECNISVPALITLKPARTGVGSFIGNAIVEEHTHVNSPTNLILGRFAIQEDSIRPLQSYGTASIVIGREAILRETGFDARKLDMKRLKEALRSPAMRRASS